MHIHSQFNLEFILFALQPNEHRTQPMHTAKDFPSTENDCPPSTSASKSDDYCYYGMFHVDRPQYLEQAVFPWHRFCTIHISFDTGLVLGCSTLAAEANENRNNNFKARNQ